VIRHVVRLLLALLVGGYMLLDGSYARINDQYIGGTLGPWAVLVKAIGIDPRSYTMNDIFIFFGICWLGAILFYLFKRRTAIFGMAIASLWYVPFGAILSIVILATYFRARQAS
jgi:hypothetical protein